MLINISKDHSEAYREAFIKSEKPAWAKTLTNKMKAATADILKIKERIKQLSESIPTGQGIKRDLGRDIAPTIKLITGKIEHLRKNLKTIQIKIHNLKIQIVSLQEHPNLKK